MKKLYRNPVAKFINMKGAEILAGSGEPEPQPVNMRIVSDEQADEWG